MALVLNPANVPQTFKSADCPSQMHSTNRRQQAASLDASTKITTEKYLRASAGAGTVLLPPYKEGGMPPVAVPSRNITNAKDGGNEEQTIDTAKLHFAPPLEEEGIEPTAAIFDDGLQEFCCNQPSLVFHPQSEVLALTVAAAAAVAVLKAETEKIAGDSSRDLLPRKTHKKEYLPAEIDIVTRNEEFRQTPPVAPASPPSRVEESSTYSVQMSAAGALEDKAELCHNRRIKINPSDGGRGAIVYGERSKLRVDASDNVSVAGTAVAAATQRLPSAMRSSALRSSRSRDSTANDNGVGCSVDVKQSRRKQGARRKKKRVVSFCFVLEVYLIPRVKDYSESEARDLWWSREQLDRMREEDRARAAASASTATAVSGRNNSMSKKTRPLFSSPPTTTGPTFGLKSYWNNETTALGGALARGTMMMMMTPCHRSRNATATGAAVARGRLLPKPQSRMSAMSSGVPLWR